MKFISRRLIYENPLSCKEDVKDFVLDGHAKIFFENERLRMKNTLDFRIGQKANFVFWCPENFPANISIEWEFTPIKEPGLAMLFFAAKGRNGEDIFDKSLAKRDGDYGMYTHGDINTYHISYFRRRSEGERNFHTCNLRKSYGFHLVAHGADPIPDVEDCNGPYRMCITKCNNQVWFHINDLEIFHFVDDGKTYGDFFEDGKIGFRQRAPLIGEYSNLRVYEVKM